MKTTICLLVMFVAGVVTYNNSATQNDEKDPMQQVYDFAELEKKRANSKRPWQQFLDVDSLFCGVYCLGVGEVDGQQPHVHDEVYYVQEGEAKITISGKDYPLTVGSIVFVPAHAEHRFHSIKKDLKTLVFFSKMKPPAKSNE